MAGDDDLPPLSGWVGTTSAQNDEDHPFKTGEDQRYDKGNLLGWGGMGTVHAAEDVRLRREVALKQGADARLPQEAWICAQLEHPGIVPVYDAGHDREGRPFYTMRLIRGRTLAEAIQHAPTFDDRIRLLRSFLAVCQAMAYAHSLGIIHRDLKPANIMVGEFGETQVVDWGIARPVDPAADEVKCDDWIPEGHRAHTLVGAVVGTPAYMSPEQAVGEPCDTRADVWSLGVILYELIKGKSPFSGADSSEILDQVINSDPPPLGEHAPPELAAIVHRALSRDISERYPSAEQLADDVEAWLDGRRVFAHDYTAAELLTRFVRAWRVPLAAAGVTLFAITFASVTAAVRIDGARQDAEAAEQNAQLALETADDRLGDALAARSADAYVRDINPEAEMLATRALLIRESPIARGVLAGSVGRRLEWISQTDLPCRAAVLSSSGLTAHCAELKQLSIWDTATGKALWALPLSARSVAIDEDHNRVLVIDNDNTLRAFKLQDGAPVFERVEGGSSVFGTSDNGFTPLTSLNNVFLYDAIHDEVHLIDACRDSNPIHTARGHGRLFVACNDGSWNIGPENGPLTSMAPLVDGAVTVAAWLDDRRIAAAVSGGAIHILDVRQGKTRGVYTPLGGRVMELLDGDDLLVANSDQLAPMLLAPHWRTRAPNGVRQMRVDGDQVTTLGPRGLERWSIPETPLVATLISAGITSVDVSPSGELVSITDGSGAASIWTGKGQQVASLVWQDLVVKAGTFSRDGLIYATAGMGNARVQLFDTDTWTLIGTSEHDSGYRRIAPIGASNFVGLTYGRDATIIEADGKTVAKLPKFIFYDAGTSSHEVALLESTGVWVHGDDSRKVFDFENGAAVDLADDGRIAVCGSHHIEIRSASGELIRELHTEERPLDVAWSPDARWIAVGTVSGAVEVWDANTGELRAHLVGHTQRVAALDFSDDGRWLFSGSWDGTARRWSVDALDADPGAWLAEAERSWSRSAEDAISARF